MGKDLHYLKPFQTLEKLLEFHYGKSHLIDNEGPSLIEKDIYELGKYHARKDKETS